MSCLQNESLIITKEMGCSFTRKKFYSSTYKNLFLVKLMKKDYILVFIRLKSLLQTYSQILK